MVVDMIVILIRTAKFNLTNTTNKAFSLEFICNSVLFLSELTKCIDNET